VEEAGDPCAGASVHTPLVPIPDPAVQQTRKGPPAQLRGSRNGERRDRPTEAP
jgi:hypothetical protein